MIKIKVSGDGRNVGEKLSVINTTYTILNEKQLAMSEKGNYLIAVLKEKENYDVLQAGLLDLINEMEETKTVKVGGNVYKIEYFLGGSFWLLFVGLRQVMLTILAFGTSVQIYRGMM